MVSYIDSFSLLPGVFGALNHQCFGDALKPTIIWIYHCKKVEHSHDRTYVSGKTRSAFLMLLLEHCWDAFENVETDWPIVTRVIKCPH